MKTKNLLKQRLWRDRTIFQRLMIITVSLYLLIWLQGLLVASWYIKKHRAEPLNLGVTFSSEYAEYLQLNPKQTFKALRDEMGFKRFRLVTFWNKVEPQPGQFDFSDIDWQLKMIDEVGGTATVSVGLRQPRWPECHTAPWAKDLPTDQRNQAVENYLAKTIEHLKDNKRVVSYQLENEYFLNFFGNCPDANRQQLIKEFQLVKKLDPTRSVLLSLSNNYIGLPTGQPRPDQFAISVYTRVWDSLFTNRYAQYPFTPNYFAYRAGLTELFTGRSSMLHELQVEPWMPNGFDLRTTPLKEQNKSMDAQRAAARVQYGIDAGFRDIDLWGGEWWYWRLTKHNDPSIWQAVKSSLNGARSKSSTN